MRMGSLYNRADIYDLFDNEKRYEAYKKHWEAIFAGKDIKSMLDVSIGSGSVTLPVIDLGVKLSGSDLSEEMLKNCGAKALKKGAEVTLKCFPAQFEMPSFEKVEWYSVMAKKS